MQIRDERFWRRVVAGEAFWPRWQRVGDGNHPLQVAVGEKTEGQGQERPLGRGKQKCQPQVKKVIFFQQTKVTDTWLLPKAQNDLAFIAFDFLPPFLIIAFHITYNPYHEIGGAPYVLREWREMSNIDNFFSNFSGLGSVSCVERTVILRQLQRATPVHLSTTSTTSLHSEKQISTLSGKHQRIQGLRIILGTGSVLM